MVGGKAIKGLGQGLPYLIPTYADWTYTRPKPVMGLHQLGPYSTLKDQVWKK